jgi:hypothetical protein
MAKLLPTRLPIATGDQVSVEIFNRLVRILEINLGGFDPTERDTAQLEAGTLIFNTTTEVLQMFDGTQFIDLTSHRTYPTGLSATSSLGSVTVTIT